MPLSFAKLRRAWTYGSIGLVTFFGATQAFAQQESDNDRQPIFVDFSYSAGSSCPDADAAFSLVHRRSRRVLRARDEAATQSLDMRIVPSAGGYRGVLSVSLLGEKKETRSMTGQSCAEVVEALALTAALSIDPDATLTLGPAEGQQSSAFPAESKDDGADMPAGREVEAQPSERLRVTVGPSLSTERLMDHTVHVGGGALFGLSRRDERRWLPLEARLTLHALLEPTRVEEGISTRALVAKLAYCPLRLGTEQALLVCPFSQLGVITARARGFDDGSASTRSLVSLGLEAWLRARISSGLELWAAPALQIPLTRREYAVSPGPEVLVSTLQLGWGVSTGLGLVF